ncbi:MAG TPA: MFS transporter, partial [Rhabdochlamydiaceae bacterium]|nr:MFS transporter [Rhabdochlamydiaceae bacterium]
LVPWFHNVWYLIFCCAVYEFFNKSGIPALIEILKINIPKQAREKTYTLYFVISFLESIVLGIFIANILDYYPSAWKLLCCFTALLSLTSIWVQIRVPIPLDTVQVISHLGFRERIVRPWKEAFLLLKSRPDFAHFQYGFMIGGFGLMLMVPSLALFYVDRLQLSHSDIVTGRSILMGIGVVISSYFWKQALGKKTVSELTFWILLGFALYPLLLIFSDIHIRWFYLSFICYGIAQAGSHLLWNLSGTLFSAEGDSSPFSRVNILMLGLRGAVAPALGGLCCDLFGPISVLIMGMGICFLGALYMKIPHRLERSYKLRH